MRRLVVDTETGGFDPAVNSILTLGLVVWEDGSIIAEKELLICEDPINAEPQALRVNKINLDDLRATGMRPRSACVALEQFVREHFPKPAELVGHNLGFDKPFIARLCKLGASVPSKLFTHRVRDTMVVASVLIDAGVLPIPGATLDLVMQHFGVKIKDGERHGALADARATAQVYSCMLRLLTTIHPQMV